MTAARYSRDELARLENTLRRLDETWGPITDDDRADLRQAADFLAETVAVLDKTRAIRQRKAAEKAIARKRNRGRR